MNVIIKGTPFGVTQLKSITDGVGILDTEINYSSEQAYSILERMGDNGRGFYLRLLLIDLIFPISYCLFMISCIFLLSSRVYRFADRLALAPIIALLFDYLENASIIVILTNYPNELVSLVQAASIFTIIKWCFIVVSYVSILALLVLFLISKVKKSKRA
jgi:hypothetical protein